MKKIILLTIAIILIPIIIVGINKPEVLDKIVYGSVVNKTVRVKRVKENKIEEIPLEEYVTGVVAGEMPALFNIEALKAQAVASRTYVLKKIEQNNSDYDVDDTTNFQVYNDNNQLKEKWQDNYEENYKKVKQAVLETKYEVIYYDNKLIDAVFFSTSNGKTENSEEVFKNSVPYLISVESNWDKEESPVYSTTNVFTREEFLYNLGFNIKDSIDIKDIKRTKTGRVKTLVINGKTFESSYLRKVFNLKSTSFKIKVDDKNVTFNVNGSGHGVGLSQYGANGMAKEGKNYKDILMHYYANCQIKKFY